LNTSGRRPRFLALPGPECQNACAGSVPARYRASLPAFIRWHQVSHNPVKFRPLHDRVVIRRLDAEEKSAGGIIIPDTAQEKPMEGEVVAAGPGARNEQGHIVALEVKAGDRILFGKWSGTEVKLDGEELVIMKESDIMGVVEGSPAIKKKAA
jgi:chaperonin GroES